MSFQDIKVSGGGAPHFGDQDYRSIRKHADDSYLNIPAGDSISHVHHLVKNDTVHIHVWRPDRPRRGQQS